MDPDDNRIDEDAERVDEENPEGLDGEEYGQEEEPQEEQPPHEEEEDDFPEYANEFNKQLNQIIKEKKKVIKELQGKTEEIHDRNKVLKDHLKNVNTELVNTQQLVQFAIKDVLQAQIDAKNKEIETEDHLKQLNERQIGRLNRELTKLEQEEVTKQERLNDVQNQIFKGNKGMEDFKLKMNWNQEELEQWSLAAKQKEEDNLALEKYKRQDEIKIKELNLEIEKLTTILNKKQLELEQEITETQAAQIELDKTAEEFKKHHEERQKLSQQWEEALETISRREEAINQEAERYAQIKIEIQKARNNLNDKKRFLDSRVNENKRIELDIQTSERVIVTKREENKQLAQRIDDLNAEVEILKNQLSAFASDLSKKKNLYAALSDELLRKKQRLNAAQKKYNAQKAKLSSEIDIARQLEGENMTAEDMLKENEKDKADKERKIRVLKDSLFKYTQELFKLREHEADLYSEIQGNMAACRNLQAHINKLNQEFQRQQELLYNAEYQIQLMERKVQRARGERTAEEKRDLETEIKKAEEELNVKVEEHKVLSKSLRQLDDDLRAIERSYGTVSEENKKLTTTIEELTLENDMTSQDLAKVVKVKEDTLVQHDIMKLEIKNIRDNLMKATYKVYNLENRKYQLEMSMQEREKEISVHHDVLKAETKAAEEERHNIAVELSDRLNKVKNLKIKYESYVQKNKPSDGAESVHDHSQAYYVIKAAQEREELQRKGDELNGNPKIIQSEKELKALDNTLSHLKNRNSNYRDGYLNKGATGKDSDQKDSLEQQMRAASEGLFKKKKDLQQKQKEYEEDMRRYTEIQNKQAVIQQKLREFGNLVNQLDREIQDKAQQLGRSENSLKSVTDALKRKNIKINPNDVREAQIQLDIEKNVTKTLQTVIHTLCVDFPELMPFVEPALKEVDLPFPDKPASSINLDVSVRSAQSSGRSSQGSRGNRQRD